LIHKLLMGGYINLFTVRPLSHDSNEVFLSSGEISLLSLFAKIEYIINPFPAQNGLDLFDQSGINDSKTLIFLLDEPDTFLHPNWSRQLINTLIFYLKDKFKEKHDIQILLATNNPFMLSDLYSHNVIKLEKNKSSKEITASNPANQTFGANIHELLDDTFFMESTVGGYAYKRITFLINQISPSKSKQKYKKTQTVCKLINEHFGTKIKKEEVYTFLDHQINLISEKVLREKMLSMLNSWYASQFSELENLKKQKDALIEQIEKLECKRDGNG